MKKAMMILTLVLSLAACSLSASAATFRDVSDKGLYSVEHIGQVSDLGFMTGVEDGVFAPYSILTRAQIVTILWRMDGCPDAEFLEGFYDVAEGAWYAEPMSWAVEHGIIQGFEFRLRPDQPMTREELLTILFRHSEEEIGAGVPTPEFEDEAEVSEWARTACHWAAMSDIMNPEDGFLCPKGLITRANMATIAMNYWQFLNERAEVLN